MARSTLPPIPSVAELLGDSYDENMQVAFPDVAVPYYPTGMLILVQLRRPKKLIKLGGGKTLILPDEAADSEKFRTQTSLVRAMGPAAFRRRDNLEPWPEGTWCQVGDFIRGPMYGGDRVAVPIPGGAGDDEVILMAIKDLDVLGVITGDPLAIKTLV
jgi:hypothetical protein